MSQIPLYPLRFASIYQYRLWGGRRLAGLLTAPLPGDGPIGEPWMLSDRADDPSRVDNGSLKGQAIGQVLEQFPEEVMGQFAGRYRRFPLLLKFLDVMEMLSVQVHSTDPATAKTEAWVVLEAGIKSRIYAGLKLAFALFRRGDGAFEAPSAVDSLSFGRSGADAFASAGTRRDRSDPPGGVADAPEAKV
jgi:mannose-6-phosphate isomerase